MNEVIYYDDETDFDDPDLCGYSGPGWYFWDETQTVLFGPYEDKYACEDNQEYYQMSLLNYNF